MRALIVTDDEIEFALVRELAQRTDGMREGLHRAVTWDDARSRLAASLDDVCLLSRSLGGRDALDLLREAAPQGWKVPVVVLARHEDPTAERQAMALGAADWLVRSRLTSEALDRAACNSVERAAATSALRDRERRFRAAFDGSVEPRVLCDDAGRLVDANPAARQVFGLAGDLAKRNVAGLFGPEAWAGFAALWASRSTRGQTEAALRVPDAQGASRNFEVALVSRITPEFHLVVLRDVTEREEIRQRLALTERLTSLGTLAAGMAHEINNPLTVVYASLDIVQDLAERARQRGGSLTAEQLDEVASELRLARNASERVQRVVRDLMAFTRSGGNAAARVDLYGTLETALRLTANTIRHRATVTRAMRRVGPVLGHEEQLTQVFVNLLLNAAQALPEGSATQHEVRVALERGADGRALVTISDTGRGMSPEVLARAFDPFFTTRPVGQGMGLGLSFCHGVVSAAGGEIAVETVEGQGTTFRVFLPTAGPTVRPGAPTPLPRMERMGRGRVLIVDDDPMVCRSLQRLVQAQHDVVALTSPSEALERLLAGEWFDAILCDVMMPEMSGIELYHALEVGSPEQAARLVFVTGGVFSPEARGFLEAGKHRVLEKPVSQPALLKTLARVIPESEE